MFVVLCVVCRLSLVVSCMSRVFKFVVRCVCGVAFSVVCCGYCVFAVV